MTHPERIVIVGGGLAGAKGAEALRDNGFSGSLTLVGEEGGLPYERPPLSKGYLAGSAEFAEAVVHDEAWYRDHDVDLRTGVAATAVDRGRRVVTLAGGDELPYDKLLLATGAVPRRLPLPGADASNVFTLRRREDSDTIREQFGAGRRLVVIGAGWIGLEVAAAARGAGTDVTVVEAMALPLLGVLGPEMGRVFADLHRDNGVDLRLEAKLEGIVAADGRATAVRVGGERLDCDAIVIGVGVAPNVELAQAAGLAVDNGVLVDATLRSSDPDIYAVGDIANHDHPVLGRRVRVEHWATALNQPAAAAASMLGEDSPYTELPYFFSDQYDLGMEYIGSIGRDEQVRVVTRGNVPGREFVAFWVGPDDAIRAAMNVNVWDVPDAVKPLIADRKPVDAGRLADPGVDYAQL